MYNILLSVQTDWSTCDAKRQIYVHIQHTHRHTHIYIYTFETEASLPVLFLENFEGVRAVRTSGSVAVAAEGDGGGLTPPRKDTQSNNNYLLEGISVVRLCVFVCVLYLYADFMYT